MFREVIDEFVLDMANGVVTAVRLYLQNDTSTTAEFMHDAVLDEIRYESMTVKFMRDAVLEQYGTNTTA